MAPSPLGAVGVGALSSSSSSASSMAASLVRRNAWVTRQQASSSSPSHVQWPVADQLKLAAVVEVDGQFNGTCNASGMSLAPQPNAGECESYYSDVTVYCCGAVGGSLVETTQQGAVDSNGDGQVGMDDTSTGLSCQTSNFNDMLLCYKYTAEEHCRSAISGPWGVCNMADASSSSNNNATSSSSSVQQQVSIATGASNAAPASLHQGRFGGAAGATVGALLVTSALLLVLGEASI